ncbi:hypothetical protein [Cellulomonas soli]
MAFIHCAPELSSPMSSMTTGRATLTIVASMITSETPRASVPMASQWRRGMGASSGMVLLVPQRSAGPSTRHL